jgi:hypothetical protein
MAPILDSPVESAETMFQCSPPAAPPQRGLATLMLGAILGGMCWYGFDRSFAWQHIALWLGISTVVIGIIVWRFSDDPLLAVGVDDRGVTLVRRARGSRTLAWHDIEAARWQEYRVPNLHTTIRALLIRARGETVELTPEFDAETQIAFENAMAHRLQDHDIPESSPTLPTFEHALSIVGAAIFALSIIGMVVAHLLVYRMLGPIFGLAFFFTGVVVAFMTRAQRLSQLVLGVAALLIVATTLVIVVGHISLRDTLNRWEQEERARHRPTPPMQTGCLSHPVAFFPGWQFGPVVQAATCARRSFRQPCTIAPMPSSDPALSTAGGRGTALTTPPLCRFETEKLSV